MWKTDVEKWKTKKLVVFKRGTLFMNHPLPPPFDYGGGGIGVAGVVNNVFIMGDGCDSYMVGICSKIGVYNCIELHHLWSIYILYIRLTYRLI